MVNKPLITIGSPAISVKIGSQPAALIVPHEQSNGPADPIVRQSNPDKRERKIRSTSFNVADPLERQLNEHADRFSSFSAYVKRLIHQDIMRGTTEASSAPFQDRYYDVMTSNVRAGFGGVK